MYTCQNITLLEITCRGSFSVSVFKGALEKNETRDKEGKTVFI